MNHMNMMTKISYVVFMFLCFDYKKTNRKLNLVHITCIEFVETLDDLRLYRQSIETLDDH